MSSSDFLFTSESVSEGHPDKLADRISDTVLDDFLKRDANARVAVETLVCPRTVVLAGETRSAHKPNFEKLVREAIRDVGYAGGLQTDFDADTVDIQIHVHGQAPEIAMGVDAGKRASEGAGDQGLMFGFAIAETDSFMPAPIYYSHKILEALADRRKRGDNRLRPDAKSQLTLEYKNGLPVRVHTALVSHQHAPTATREELQGIVAATLEKVLPPTWIDKNTRILTNPTGSFINGGPGTDTGLTGRKIIVDTYGGFARHGGGAFSGKDPTKVDRSAAYAARYLAKNIVAAGLCYACEIQVCYAIGVAEPLAIYLNTYGTISKKNVTEAKIEKALRKSLSLTPRGMREHLGLAKPIYVPTSSYGHFGRTPKGDLFPWEKTDLVATLLKNM